MIKFILILFALSLGFMAYFIVKQYSYIKWLHEWFINWTEDVNKYVYEHAKETKLEYEYIQKLLEESGLLATEFSKLEKDPFKRLNLEHKSVSLVKNVKDMLIPDLSRYKQLNKKVEEE